MSSNETSKTDRELLMQFRELMTAANGVAEGSLERSILCDFIEEHGTEIMAAVLRAEI